MINNRQKKKSIAPRVLMVTMLIVLIALVYWYFNPSSRPAWLADKLPVAASATTTVYKWKSENGVTMVSDHKPPEGVEYEVVEYRNDQNVIESTNDEG